VVARLGKRHPNTLFTASDLANILADMGRDEEAKELLGEFFPSQDIALSTLDPRTIGLMHQYAVVIYRLGEYEKSLSVYRLTLERSRKVHGERNLNTLNTMHGLGLSLYKAGDYERAKDVYREMIRHAREELGESNATFLGMVINYAVMAFQENDHELAELLLKDSMPLALAGVEGDGGRIFQGAVVSATLALARGEHEEFRTRCRSAYQWTKQQFGDDHHYSEYISERLRRT
nr:tetratricopeptide repeat protein [Micromonospora sp. DSM 115978]